MCLKRHATWLSALHLPRWHLTPRHRYFTPIITHQAQYTSSALVINQSIWIIIHLPIKRTFCLSGIFEWFLISYIHINSLYSHTSVSNIHKHRWGVQKLLNGPDGLLKSHLWMDIGVQTCEHWWFFAWGEGWIWTLSPLPSSWANTKAQTNVCLWSGHRRTMMSMNDYRIQLQWIPPFSKNMIFQLKWVTKSYPVWHAVYVWLSLMYLDFKYDVWLDNNLCIGVFLFFLFFLAQLPPLPSTPLWRAC